MECISWKVNCLILFCLVLSLEITLAVDLSSCYRPLGMQSGAIPDSAITASSSYDDASVGPANARIRTERNGGAWCPRQQVSKNVYEWLEIDLQENRAIMQIETQGRFGNGQGQEYADSYKLEYQRIQGEAWKKFRDRKGSDILSGNVNTFVAEARNISPPIIARKIRIVPYSVHPRIVCMRVEVYGCLWKGGLVAYNMPQGERRGNEVDLYDFTYDGKISKNYLSNGLGQLTDGIEGHSNFRQDSDGIGKKGYQWIGWKSDLREQPSINIIFEFDSIRNFTSARFHCNNMYSKDVRVFRRALLYFGVTSGWFQEKPVVFDYMRDMLMESSRYVIISIPHRVGKFIRAELYFDAKWLMLSEVFFESNISNVEMFEGALLSFGTILPTLGYQTVQTTSNTKHPFDNELSYYDSSSLDNFDMMVESHLDEQLIGVVIGIAVASVLLLTFAVLLCFVRSKLQQKHSFCHESNRNKFSNLRSLSGAVQTSVGQASGKFNNGLRYNSVNVFDVDEEDSCVINGKNFHLEKYLDGIQMLKFSNCSEDMKQDSEGFMMEDGSSANPDVTWSPYHNSPTHYLSPHRASAVPAGQLNNYTNLSTSKNQSMQGFIGAYSFPEMYLNGEEDIEEFPRNDLCFIETLGHCSYGEIQLCEALINSDVECTSMTSPSDIDDIKDQARRNKVILVAVKMLQNSADKIARTEFQREIIALNRLRNVNIAGLLGICIQTEPQCIVMEYANYGDLKQFLRENSESSTKKSGLNDLSHGCLIYMAMQIASGMKYLESIEVIHRDLAARNCLVGEQYSIKISDLAINQQLYARDYYLSEDMVRLPIRWMACESILLGKYSLKSTVWSFAVTLWELFDFAHRLPFNNCNDEQVIDRFQCYDGINYQVELDCPKHCPKEIYDLMQECWNVEDVRRPSFHEIHMFLQRKNVGYNVLDDLTRSVLPLNVPFV